MQCLLDSDNGQASSSGEPLQDFLRFQRNLQAYSQLQLLRNPHDSQGDRADFGLGIRFKPAPQVPWPRNYNRLHREHALCILVSSRSSDALSHPLIQKILSVYGSQRGCVQIQIVHLPESWGPCGCDAGHLVSSGRTPTLAMTGILKHQFR